MRLRNSDTTGDCHTEQIRADGMGQIPQPLACDIILCAQRHGFPSSEGHSLVPCNPLQTTSHLAASSLQTTHVTPALCRPATKRSHYTEVTPAAGKHMVALPRCVRGSQGGPLESCGFLCAEMGLTSWRAAVTCHNGKKSSMPVAEPSWSALCPVAADGRLCSTINLSLQHEYGPTRSTSLSHRGLISEQANDTFHWFL